jgi:hypothetical protein
VVRLLYTTYVDCGQHTSVTVSIRQHTSGMRRFGFKFLAGVVWRCLAASICTHYLYFCTSKASKLRTFWRAIFGYGGGVIKGTCAQNRLLQKHINSTNCREQACNNNLLSVANKPLILLSIANKPLITIYGGPALHLTADMLY